MSTFCEVVNFSATPTVYEVEVQDPVILAAFQALFDVVGDYVQYTNRYSSVEDWDPPCVEVAVQSLTNAYTTYLHKTPVEAVFFSMMRGNLLGMRYKYNPPPLDSFENIFMHDALQVLYCHMGYPSIDQMVFWDLADVMEKYSTYSNEFDDWYNPKVAAFREFPRGFKYISYVRLEWFRRFSQLPGELHEAIIHEYLLLEREASRLSRNQHYDEFKNSCCKWEYPDLLIACGGQDTTVLPKPETGRCPRDW